MKNVGKKTYLNSLKEYKTTLILFSILLAVMSLVIFMPLKHEKVFSNVNPASYSK